MKGRWMAVAAILLVAGFFTIRSPAEGSPGYTIILQAGTGTHEGKARALHALLYAGELKQHGHDVVLILDGAGTEWAAAWSEPAARGKLAAMYRKLRGQGVAQVVCDFCATAFGVKKSLAEHGAPLVAEYSGHPSIAKWADRGYRILVL